MLFFIFSINIRIAVSFGFLFVPDCLTVRPKALVRSWIKLKTFADMFGRTDLDMYIYFETNVPSDYVKHSYRKWPSRNIQLFHRKW